jgi:UDP-N-acetylglucosamine 2-epimerase (non-hydrolysing)
MTGSRTHAHVPGRSIAIVVGARPNFVKVAPVLRSLSDRGAETHVIHTGQHYHDSLSRIFIEQLGLPEPDENLGVGSGSHAEQTAGALVGVERALQGARPDAVVVAGDVNSTLAAALAAVKLGIPIVHIESGLRSHDWTMPEEINRVVCDRISDLLLCTSADAVENLEAEGIAGDCVALVGNTMIDSLVAMLGVAARTGIVDRLGLDRRGYALVTLHRPVVVDVPERLDQVVEVLVELAAQLPVVFPAHPRTRERLLHVGSAALGRIRVLDPLDYLEFLALEAAARVVVTDSGGVQEETTALGVPCLTYRDNTERPVTVELGTNRVVGVDPAALAEACREELASDQRFEPAEIPLWDGAAGPRAAEAILRMLERPRAKTEQHFLAPRP